MTSKTLTSNTRQSNAKIASHTPTSGFENGSFETGDYQGWNTIGDTSIETDQLGIFPTDGKHQALMTTGDSDAGGSVVDGDLEEFLDLKPGSLDKLVHGHAIEGSVIKQTFTAKAGDVVSFDWNFVTNESTPSKTYNDTAFLSVGGFAFELADTEAKFVHANHVDGFEEQTDTQTLDFKIAKAGTYTIGFGVVDVGDDAVDSGLVIDNLEIQSLDKGKSHHGISSHSKSSSSSLVFGDEGFATISSDASTDSASGLVFGENGFEVV